MMNKEPTEIIKEIISKLRNVILYESLSSEAQAKLYEIEHLSHKALQNVRDMISEQNENNKGD